MSNLYRKGVGAFIINNNNQIFMAERLDIKNQWQMPQGGVETGEDLDIAIFRELKEEVGTDKFEIIAKTDWLKYELSPESRAKLSNGKYIGQQQIWYFLKFTGADSDINLSADIHPEFASWQWVEKQELVESIIDFKKAMYQEILKFAIENKIVY
jgi:putative (di)nucleoside polyphosphate hydrolase